MNLLFDLYKSDESYNRQISLSYESSDMAHNRVKALQLSILGHILFPKEPKYVDIGLLELKDQSDQTIISFQH